MIAVDELDLVGVVHGRGQRGFLRSGGRRAGNGLPFVIEVGDEIIGIVAMESSR